MQAAKSSIKASGARKVIGAVIALLAIAGLIAGPSIKRRWSAPLGPELELPTYTPTTPEPSSTATSQILTQKNTPLPTNADTPTARTQAPATRKPSPTPAPLCGGPPVMMILGVGVDIEDDSYTYGLGDAIRVARVDFVTPKVSVLTFPRDLWVEIPGISDHYGLTHGKLNQSFLYGGSGMGYYDGPGGGAGLMARTLDKNFGLRVDHYGAVNMSTFARIVDAVGGIDIYLPYDVDGTPIDSMTEDMGYFYAGQNHFDGDEALRFSRIRKRYNDLTRMDHQTMVLCALKKKLTSASVLPKIPEIVAAVIDSTITDLSLEQISQLACLLPSIKRENLLFTSFPEELFTPTRVYSPQMRDNTFVMEADQDILRDYVAQFVQGTWPNETKEPSCP